MTLQERLEKHLGQTPVVAEDAYVASSAIIIGNVRLGPRASVWPMCVLRGDINSIVVGEGSNLQDGTIVHLADDYGVKIGSYVTVGHGAMLHACTIQDECLVGMRATILDGAVIGRNSIIGAGALVTKGTFVPQGSVVMGMPGKVLKTLSPEDQQGLRYWAKKYIEVAAAHREKEHQHPYSF